MNSEPQGGPHYDFLHRDITTQRENALARCREIEQKGVPENITHDAGSIVEQILKDYEQEAAVVVNYTPLKVKKTAPIGRRTSVGKKLEVERVLSGSDVPDIRTVTETHIVRETTPYRQLDEVSIHAIAPINPDTRLSHAT